MTSAIDLVWIIVGFILTLLIFSYVLGDNPLFRLTAYILVGVSAGYLFVLIFYQVIQPRLVQPFYENDSWQLILHLGLCLLCLLLLTKLSPRLARLGVIPMAYLVGVGAAVTIGGAIIGTIVTQVKATIVYHSAALYSSVIPGIQILEGLVILLGTVVTLAYFHFGAKPKVEGQVPGRPLWLEILSYIGKIFIAITFGAVFASVYVSALTALIDRLGFIIKSLDLLFKAFG